MIFDKKLKIDMLVAPITRGKMSRVLFDSGYLVATDGHALAKVKVSGSGNETSPVLIEPRVFEITRKVFSARKHKLINLSILPDKEKQKLNKEVRTEPVVNEARINRKNISDDLELNSVKDSTVRGEPEDTRIKVSEERLLKIRTAQSEKGLNLEFGPKDSALKETLKDASEQLDEVNSKSQEIKDIAADYINCSNGN